MNNSNKAIVPANDFHQAHPLVKSTWHHFRTRKLLDPQGRLEPNARFACLDVTVSIEQSRRALLIFDAIIRACSQEGWRVFKPERTHYTRNAETLVLVGDQEVHIAIIEKVTRRDLTELELAEEEQKQAYLRRQSCFTPTGLLWVGVGLRRFDLRSTVIKETENVRLDTQIPQVIALLKREAERQRADKLKDEEKELILRNQQHARMQNLRDQEIEIERQKSLEQLANDGTVSERIRLFANSCEKSFSQTIEARVLNEWLIWARAHADRIDPIKNGAALDAINSHSNKHSQTK